MVVVRIKVPRIKGVSETELANSIKKFIQNRYEISGWQVSIEVIKSAPSLRLKGRRKVGEWRVID